MAPDNNRQLDPGGGTGGVCPRVHWTTPTGISAHYSSGRSRQPGETGGTGTNKEESYRTCRPKLQEGQVLQHLLFKAQENWRPEADFEFASPQQAPASAIFQNGPSGINSGEHKTRLLCSIPRSDGCIPAYSNQGITPQVPVLCDFTGRALPVLSTLFWPQNCSPSLHEDSIRDRGNSTEAGSLYFPIPGRLAASAPKQASTRETTTRSAEPDSVTRVLSELGEVRPISEPSVHIPGSEIRPGVREPIPLRRQADKTASSFTGSPRGVSRSGGLVTSAGHHGLMHRDSAVGQTTHETTATISTLTMEAVQSGHQSCHRPPRTYQVPSGLVVEELEPDGRSPNRKTPSTTDAEDRRVHQFRLGGLHSQRSLCPGEVVSHRRQETHQLVGTDGCMALPQGVPELSLGQVHPPSIRQYDSSALCEQGGRDQISQPLLSHLGPHVVVPRESGVYQGGSSGRFGQSSSGLAFAQDDVSAGMVPEQISGEQTFSQTRETTCGSVRISRERSPANLLRVEAGPSGSSSRRAHDLMEQHASLCIPSDSSDSESARQGREGRMQVTPHSPSVASETLVLPAHQTVTGPTSNPPSQARPSEPAQGSSASSRPKDIPIGSMAAIRKNLRKEGFSRGAAKLISCAVRSSTRSVYQGRFQEFARWCNKRNLDPFHAPIKEIANFLAKLHKKGLSYSTVCGYRSAISSYHSLVDNTKVGSNPTLISLLRGVFTLNPPSRTLAPPWDLPKVLKALRGLPFEPMTEVPLKWVSMKTAFLVAVSTAGRSSDLQNLGCREPYLRYEKCPKGIRFVPKNLRKQGRPGHCFKDMFVAGYEEDRKLDPVRAIKIYLRRTNARRGKLSSLFITYGAGEVKSPKAQTIAHWVVDTIQQAYGPGVVKGVHAHSTRGASTSMALWKGCGIENILKAADWSSTCTFARHYLREFRERDTVFTRTVLGSAK